MVLIEPTDHELFQIMIAGEMDTTKPQLSGLARARAARNAMLAAALKTDAEPKAPLP